MNIFLPLTVSIEDILRRASASVDRKQVISSF